MHTPTRRTVLGSAGTLLTALAGCTRFETTSAPQNETGTADALGATSTPELDIREANVTAVAFDEQSGGDYRFDVTLYHDDDGEDGYANWWQVERLDGEQLGRRELLHAHSTEPFTRSATISIPADVDCVVVRGHDQTHGYGGQAMTVSVRESETNVVRQGTARVAIEATDCP